MNVTYWFVIMDVFQFNVLRLSAEPFLKKLRPPSVTTAHPHVFTVVTARHSVTKEERKRRRKKNNNIKKQTTKNKTKKTKKEKQKKQKKNVNKR